MHINTTTKKAAHVNNKRETPKPHPKKEAKKERDHSPKHEQTLANLKKFTTKKPTLEPQNHPPPQRQQTTPAPKQIGTDFRYTVEFSKNGRTPSEVSRPPPGQPDLHYRLTSATPNRLGPLFPTLWRSACSTNSDLRR